MTDAVQRRRNAVRDRESRRKHRKDAERRQRESKGPPDTGVREPRPPKVPVLSGGAEAMKPSERYAVILKVLPYEKQLKVASYVDDAHEQGDPPSHYGVRTWKELVQHLVEFESGTKYATDQDPIKDYLLYWKEVEEVAGPPPWE